MDIEEKEEYIGSVELSFEDMGVKVDIMVGEKIKLTREDLSVEGRIESIKVSKIQDKLPEDEDEEEN